MFIPVYVILLFSVTVFQSTFECNKFLCHEDLKSVKSVCDNKQGFNIAVKYVTIRVLQTKVISYLKFPQVDKFICDVVLKVRSLQHYGTRR